ncbi:MAG TPA: thiamine-phosphate kinase, partial [Archangium sp.]
MDEFGLIEVFTRQFDVAPSPRGPGDDCAVLPRQGPSCVTTDAIVDGVHFTRKTFSFEDIGHKALAVNLSDLAAMGATPRWFTVALGLPDDVSAKDLAKLGRGMSALARTHGVELIGGNVTESRQLSLTLTLSGELEGAAMLRSGARPGDALYVSGPLGEASAGLVHHAISEAQRRPTPHVAFGQFARRFASACIDVSDGLAQDLGHVCKASGVGANVWRDALPLT